MGGSGLFAKAPPRLFRLIALLDGAHMNRRPFLATTVTGALASKYSESLFDVALITPAFALDGGERLGDQPPRAAYRSRNFDATRRASGPWCPASPASSARSGPAPPSASSLGKLRCPDSTRFGLRIKLQLRPRATRKPGDKAGEKGVAFRMAPLHLFAWSVPAEIFQDSDQLGMRCARAIAQRLKGVDLG